MTNSDFNSAQLRIDAAIAAGKAYQQQLESLRASLDSDNAGTSLGTMVGMQVALTEEESFLAVEGGAVVEAIKPVANEAEDVRQTRGQG